MKRISTTPLPPIIYERYDRFDIGGWKMMLGTAAAITIISLGIWLTYLFFV